MSEPINQNSQKQLVKKAINIKGKKYVLVSDRVIYFNQTYKNGSIKTDLITDPESNSVVIKAVIVPDSGSPERSFTGYSQAIKGDGMINKSAALENAETSAVGRALALMGIGVIDSIASVDEVNKAEASAGTRNKLASDKQIAWMRSEASQVSGYDSDQEIDGWIEKYLTVKPQQIPVFKVKDAVDKIREIGKEIKTMEKETIDKTDDPNVQLEAMDESERQRLVEDFKKGDIPY